MNAAKRKMAIKFAGVALLLAAGLCPERVCGANIVSAGSGGFWDVAATWSPAQIPTNTDNVTITNGCTVTNRDIATHYAANLTIQTNGVLTHSANGSTEAYKVILNIASNLTIDPGGAINVDGMGYSNGNGPGVGSGNQWSSSHGGVGSVGSGTPGLTYGSITAPTNCGSSARVNASVWNSGGGVILLSVGGTATVNGVISASGGTNGLYDGGSGGSVFLTAGSLAGNGTIQVNGGNPSQLQFSGGGGRIAVILTNSTDFSSVKMHAYSGTAPLYGAAGTVYLENTNNTAGHGTLVVDANNLVSGDRIRWVTMQNGKDPSLYAFSKIILTNAAVYGLDSNDTLNITSTTILGDPADTNRYTGIYVKGALTVPAAFVVSNYSIGIGATNATFNPTTSLTIGTNATLLDDVPLTLNCPMTIQAGGWLSHSANGATEAYKINLTIGGNLDIQTGAQVNVDGLGYAAGTGISVGSGNGWAGSYGGMGGINASSSISPPTYGSVTAPTNCGSGGRNTSGGGAIQLNVSGTTTVNGVISAAGASGNSSIYNTGPGGSVFLTTGALTGNGTIQANGGKAGGDNGGGGRIAVILTNSADFSNVKMRAYSGTASSGYGAAGTVYQQTQAQGSGQGTLLIDASNIVPEYAWITTQINSNVTGLAVGTVVITNKAVFQITNQSLTVNGSWTNRATFLANTNSTVVFSGANAATVTGNNTFYNLTCTSAVKTVVFETGKTNTVLGQLTLSGVTLKSTVDGQYTYLTLSTNGGSQQIGAVTVQDNNAGGGQLLLAGPRSANNGHNVNWKFPVSGTTFFFR